MSTEEGVERVLKDQAARDAVTTELHRNVTVLAGAGAGKTHALIERMVALVRTGTSKIDRIAAITFTRKAAGEMRGRFLLRLAEAKNDAQGEELVRIREALRQIDQCFIGTIHSFCGRLLRERPIEAGLPPDFSEIEQREEIVLRRGAWDAFVQGRIAEEDERLAELEEHGIAPEDLYTFFGQRCGYRDLPLKETNTPRPDLKPYVAEIETFLQEVQPRIPNNPAARDPVMDAVRGARNFIANHGIATDRDRATLLKFFEGNLKPTLKNWGEERGFAKLLKDERLPRLQERVVTPALRRWRECAYRTVARFVDDAVAHYDRARQEQGKVTFQDLLLRADAVLRENPGIRSYFQHRFETILVDEFQDTDPIQARILMYLAGTDVTERNWLKLTPRPGSLFLVGDDKQSIYRFRRADVDTFRQVRERIDATGGVTLKLNTSFRSLGNLCRWLSATFPAIFDAASEPYQAPFSPLHEYRAAGIDPHCVRKITIPKVRGNKRPAIVETDADRIAGYIAAAVRGETPLNADGEGGILGSEASPGDFMVLTRTRGQLSAYARALEKRGIPFDIAGGARLGDSAEVRTLVHLLETIYDPNNPIHFLSYLRGALVGLADDELYAFRQAGGRFHYRSEIPESLDADLFERLCAARDLLERAEVLLTTRPPASAVEQILEVTGLLSYAAVHPEGQASFRAGNLLRVLSVVREHEARGMHWGEIVEDLRDLVDDTEYDVEEMTLEAGRDDVVRLMNLHQAKGLQAKVVFLADPYDLAAYKGKVSVHVSRSGDAPYLAATVTKPKGEYAMETVAQPEGWQEDVDEEERFEAAEEGRLLYVAATRAANLLVVSRYAGNADKGPWQPLYRYLEDVPELSRCDAEPLDRTSPARLDWTNAQDLQRERRMRARRETYVVRSVSTAVDSEKFEYFGKEGRGRTYGVLVHHLLDEAVRGVLPEDEPLYVRQAVGAAGLDEALWIDAARALQRFRGSELWQEVRAADEVFTEVPLGRRAKDGAETDITRGVIDLVYRTGDVWRIVDYKTDEAASEQDLALLEKRYRAQIESYAAYWEEISGGTVGSSRLWFVHGPGSDG